MMKLCILATEAKCYLNIILTYSFELSETECVLYVKEWTICGIYFSINSVFIIFVHFSIELKFIVLISRSTLYIREIISLETAFSTQMLTCFFIKRTSVEGCVSLSFCF